MGRNCVKTVLPLLLVPNYASFQAPFYRHSLIINFRRDYSTSATLIGHTLELALTERFQSVQNRQQPMFDQQRMKSFRFGSQNCGEKDPITMPIDQSLYKAPSKVNTQGAVVWCSDKKCTSLKKMTNSSKYRRGNSCVLRG